MSQNIKPTFIFIATLGILSMLPPLGVDMYIPSFLNIAEDLNINSEQVQHTLTFFAYGMAAGQLFWGPFGDSFGRKPIILLGVIIGAITAIILTGIHSIGSFTVLRFIQGFFGAAPVVLSGALLRDLFSKDQLSRVMSTITLVFMIAPLVAPVIGGYIVKYFHWHMIFYVIGAMGFLAALLVFFIIPETHKKENRIPLRLNIIARNFMTLSKQKEVLGYMTVASFGFGGLFAFITAGSIVYIGIYGIPVDQFGYFFMLNIAIMTTASYLNGKFVLKLGAETMLQIGIAVQFISGIWLFLTALFGLVLVVLTAVIIFGGVKRIATISSSVVPMMALFYLIMAVIILGMHIDMIPTVIANIYKSAFTFQSAAGGMFGALVSKAMMMGIKRGLFSNEAGMGSAPNAAAAAHVKHPVSQGLVQMLGVFVDTMIVCTCTAVIILLSDNYGSETLKSISLTQNALSYHVGEFGVHFLAFILLLFAYSSIIGNYAYAESNIRFIKNKPWFVWSFRLSVLFFVYFGSVKSGNVVWNFADTVMAVMAIINLVAIVLLSPIVWKLMKDYQRQLKEGKEPEFKIDLYPEIKKRVLEHRIWK